MIFLDTSFLVALGVDADSNHKNAVELMNRILEGKAGETVISDYIFDETVTITYSKTKNLEKATKLGTSLKKSVLIKLNDKDFEETWELFKKQADTKLSFTDCSSLVIMKRLGIKNIATFDEDFKKIREINVNL
ncbi:MAG: PIN domain-containing protein [Candidatus Aenigmatarchaeota archaeon]